MIQLHENIPHHHILIVQFHQQDELQHQKGYSPVSLKKKERKKHNQIKIIILVGKLHTNGYFGTSPIFSRNEGLCGPLLISNGFPTKGRISYLLFKN